MAQITLAHGLPFVSVVVRANGSTLVLEHILLDTGSAATMFKTEEMYRLGIHLESRDVVEFIRGVGGREPVVEKTVEAIELDDLVAGPMTVQVGAMSYGMVINGILGLDFLLRTGAEINLQTLEIGRG
jgi:hypothetical protein